MRPMSGRSLRDAAEAALGEPLDEFVARHRRAKASWQTITQELSEATDGQIQLNRETLRQWFREAHRVEDPHVPPEYLTVGAAVMATGYASGTVRMLFDRGELSGTRNARGHRFIDPSSVEALASSVSIGQAARLSGRSVQTLRRHFDDGRLSGFRTSTGNRRIYRDALAQLIDETVP